MMISAAASELAESSWDEIFHLDSFPLKIASASTSSVFSIVLFRRTYPAYPLEEQDYQVKN